MTGRVKKDENRKSEQSPPWVLTQCHQVIVAKLGFIECRPEAKAIRLQDGSPLGWVKQS